MKDFESVERYDPSEVLTDRWEMGSMDKTANGDYVSHEDYLDLLEAFKELRKEKLEFSLDILGNK